MHTGVAKAARLRAAAAAAAVVSNAVYADSQLLSVGATSGFADVSLVSPR
jgi:hypothetical protein